MFSRLPPDLPVPQDDGSCNHLLNARLPSATLAATIGTSQNLAELGGWVVVYCYPMTGKPDSELPPGWDAIPGARGCTPQSCAFRDHFHELKQLDVQVFGLSMQSTAYQKEAAERLHLPFPLLSDQDARWTDALQLPTFLASGMRLNKRVTLIAYDGSIRKYFYPVFPPDKNAEEVLAWLNQVSTKHSS